MSVSILGQHISVVRPSGWRKPLVGNPWRKRRKGKPKTIVKGKVAEVIVKTLDGTIWGLARGTHLDVCNAFNIDFEDVISTGWRLENGKEVWR